MVKIYETKIRRRNSSLCQYPQVGCAGDDYRSRGRRFHRFLFEDFAEAVHKYSGKIKAMVVPVKLVATVVTLAAGGPVGKEAPCAQIGAGYRRF